MKKISNLKFEHKQKENHQIIYYMNTQSILNPVNLMPLAARVPRVTSKLNWKDKLGAVKVRLAINRYGYMVNPGLYAIGNPSRTSDVFVTSNYKLTFDVVRKNLAGFNAWILVLDTKGINVWCAAGKGTFGTVELVKRINETSLKDIVSHQKLILPQLGAVGVAAHKVKEQTGFTVTYGPVRAQDIRPYVENGYKATPTMRRVEFPWFERLKLVPVEIVLSYKYLLAALMLLIGLSGFHAGGYSLSVLSEKWVSVFANVIVAFLTGTLLAPLLLPYLPFRSFSAKGLSVGIVVTAILFAFNLLGINYLENISWVLIFTSMSSFLSMNFTGASTYTSLSGVLKEMKIGIPIQAAGAIAGLVLFTVSRFFN